MIINVMEGLFCSLSAFFSFLSERCVLKHFSVSINKSTLYIDIAQERSSVSYGTVRKASGNGRIYRAVSKLITSQPPVLHARWLHL